MLQWGQLRSQCKTQFQAAAEANMYSNNFNGAMRLSDFQTAPGLCPGGADVPPVTEIVPTSTP